MTHPAILPEPMDPLHTSEAVIERNLSLLFRLGMWWRIAYGTLRFIAAAVLLRHIGTSFTDLLEIIMRHELVEDPADAVFQFLYSVIEDRSFTVTYFVAAYLMFWGFIDVFLSFCLLKHRLWAFPMSIFLITLFILYSTYRLFHTHSLVLLGVIVVDLFILYLIHREYRVLKNLNRGNPTPSGPLPHLS